MDNNREPSQEEIKALIEFRNKFGNDWKDELAFLYYGGGSYDRYPYGQALKEVITRQGLGWLESMDISEDGEIILASRKKTGPRI